MTEHRTLVTAPRMAADRESSFIVGPRRPVLIDGFEHLDGQAHCVRKQRITALSGSADYNARPMTIDATDYKEIKASAQTAHHSLRSVVGPLVVFAAAAVVAITFSLTPASDGPAPIAGPLSGHSILHFPR